MRLFVDNCLPPRLARALHELSEPDGHSVIHLRAKFEPNAADEVWIPTLGQESDWVIVSGDVRITRVPHLRETWAQSGLTAFFLEKGWTNLKLWDQSWYLVRWWPYILSQAAMVEAGSGFFVPAKPSGKFKPVALK